MPAILTHKYRTFLAQQIFNQLGANTAAYIFVGRVTPWVDASNVAVSDTNPPAPVDEVQTVDFDYWRDLIGIKKISQANTQFVVARTNWKTGTIYAQYDDLDTALATKTYYILDTTNIPYKVYKCLWNNKGAASTVAPGAVVGTALVPTETSDKYVWQYMYTIGTDNYRFLTEKWMPVLSDSTIQSNSLTNAGKLPLAVPLVIIGGGSGYNAAIQVTTTLTGDGTGASVTANGVTVTGGVVTRVQLGTGGLRYTQVTSINVYQSGASVQATARVIIPPYPNHGYDPVKELFAQALMLCSQFDTSEIGKLTTGNEFRRVGLITNAQNTSGNVVSSDFYRNTTDITITANTGILNPDDVVKNTTKGSAPYATIVDILPSGNNYVVRVTALNPKGEVEPFSNGDVIKCFASGVEATVGSVSAPELTQYSGNILYVNQRTPVARGASQTEEIKLVLPLG